MTQADSVHSTPPINTSAIPKLQSPDKPPGKPQDSSLYVPTDISPEELFKALGRLRSEAEAEIERLLTFLDDLDGDPDLECYLTGYAPGMDDREGGECVDESAQCDDEGVVAA